MSFPVNALDAKKPDSASYRECEDKELHTGKLEWEDMVTGCLILPEGETNQLSSWQREKGNKQTKKATTKGGLEVKRTRL